MNKTKLVDDLNSLKEDLANNNLTNEQFNKIMRLINSAQYKSYDAGFVAGMECFSYQKDGVYFVGTSGTSLKEAKLKMKEMYNYSPSVVDIFEVNKND